MDYLALADRFPEWVLADVPVLGTHSRNAAQRFANVIDVLCDRDTRLTLTAAAPPEEIFDAAPQPFDVDRTRSWLSLLRTITAKTTPEPHRSSTVTNPCP
jgi:cell division protein ZapE